MRYGVAATEGHMEYVLENIFAETKRITVTEVGKMVFGCESALITLYAESRMYKVKRASNTYSFYLHWDNVSSSSRRFVLVVAENGRR